MTVLDQRLFSVDPANRGRLPIYKNQGDRRFIYVDFAPFILNRSTINKAATTITIGPSTGGRVPLVFAGGGGNGAAGYALTNDAGVIVSTVLTNGGGGYTSVPTVTAPTFGSPVYAAAPAVGATLTAVVADGVVKAVTVDGGASGTGYDLRPYVGANPGAGLVLGTPTKTGNAIATVPVSAGGANYVLPPDIAITGAGTGALVRPVLIDGVIGTGTASIVPSAKTVDRGAGYSNGEFLDLVDPLGIVANSMGDNAARVTGVNGSNGITQITVDRVVKGYMCAPNLVPQTSTPTSPAVNYRVNVSNRVVDSVTVVNGGGGYTDTPGTTITHQPNMTVVDGTTLKFRLDDGDASINNNSGLVSMKIVAVFVNGETFEQDFDIQVYSP